MANIIITGANEGIGYYMTKELLTKGNKVAVLDINTDNLQKLKTEYSDSLIYFKADIRCEKDINNAVENTINAFGNIDIAVHNACKCTFETEANSHIDVYKDVFEVNYFGALKFTKSVLPFMQKAKKGRVIFTSSGVGVTGFMGISPYASTKGALEALAKCLKTEYAKDNITFHIIHPPLTRTKSSAPLPVPQEYMASPEKVGQGLAKHINSKRFIICHSVSQKIQTMGCYLFPIKMGNLLSKMTANYEQPK